MESMKYFVMKKTIEFEKKRFNIAIKPERKLPKVQQKMPPVKKEIETDQYEELLIETPYLV